MGLHTRSCTSFWWIVGVCSEEFQDSSSSYRWEFSIEFEELITVLSQIEACLNSRPLGVIPHYNDEGMEVLTPGHFLIGRPIEAIPDSDLSYRPLPTLRRWHLCEGLVCHF